MLSEYDTEKLLGMQDVEVKNIENDEKEIRIHIRQYRKSCVCPRCGRETDRVHDYRLQVADDLPSFGKRLRLLYRKRRYVCSCGKRFYEPCDFLPRYQRRTQRMSVRMLEKLSEVCSYSSVAREYGVSGATVMRLFDIVSYPRPKELPEALGIDEFKGNSGSQKYHCILTDLENGRVIDILRTRYENELIDYFKQYDRSKVRYIVTDMYSAYSEVVKAFFPKATYIIDKYHWIRQSVWAFESVRKEAQKKFSKSHRIYFKRSRTLLLKRQSALSDEQWQQVSNMLYLDADLSSAYFLKEQLYRLLGAPSTGTDIPSADGRTIPDDDGRRKAFTDWIRAARDSGIQPFVKCAETYSRWFEPIMNSMKVSYTNAFTEGCNNKIKVAKRNAFGFRNFTRFRNRILYLFRDKAK